MIVLDEQLKNAGLVEQIGQWYRGRVGYITALRPGTVIKDEAIPALLCQVNDPTFVTINTTDFWGRITAEESYCITCFPLSDNRCLMTESTRYPIFCDGFFGFRHSAPNGREQERWRSYRLSGNAEIHGRLGAFL